MYVCMYCAHMNDCVTTSLACEQNRNYCPPFQQLNCHCQWHKPSCVVVEPFDNNFCQVHWLVKNQSQSFIYDMHLAMNACTDLWPVGCNVFKRLLVVHCKHTQEPFSRAHILVSHRTEGRGRRRKNGSTQEEKCSPTSLRSSTNLPTPNDTLLHHRVRSTYYIKSSLFVCLQFRWKLQHRMPLSSQGLRRTDRKSSTGLNHPPYCAQRVILCGQPPI